jgi:Ni/Co efflux regulator RcnB
MSYSPQKRQEPAMHIKFRQPAVLATLVVAASLWTATAQGAKPEGAGSADKRSVQGKQDKRSGKTAAVPVTIGGYFAESHRAAARGYYQDPGRQPRGKACPPGLAKKNNGCMPPGQARKWAVGQTLPRDVVYYPVPHAVEVRLGIPPAGYRYVRVAADILLIAVGTRMVVDGIQDLVR